MYKIDKKKVFNVLTGVLLSSSLVGLMGCVSPNDNASFDSSDTALAEEHNYNHTALFFDGNTAILIPCNSFRSIKENFIEISPYNYEDEDVTFSSCDITIFNDSKELSSYDKALNFALSLTSEVYNYDDVIYGEYNNIALGYKIQNEMGITKKKDL
ncbi:MAG: hypothetical protein IKE90_02935 [Bacilli bacterium]|nr:hypothetical protein [Bacilli bacterium]